MTEPQYRFGDPPPAAVLYRRKRAADRQLLAGLNRYRANKARCTTQASSSSAIPLPPSELRRTQQEKPTS